MKRKKFALEKIKENKNYPFYQQNAELRIRLAEKVWQRRKELGLSQKDLARKVRATQSIISEIESADYNPGLELLGRIVQALNLDSQDLGEVFNIPSAFAALNFEVGSETDSEHQPWIEARVDNFQT